MSEDPLAPHLRAYALNFAARLAPMLRALALLTGYRFARNPILVPFMAPLQHRLHSAIRRITALMAKLAAKYGQLTEAEIKTLVVDDKWLATIAAAVQGELDRVSQTLTGRIRQLAERYATPLPKLTDEVAELDAKVSRHLERMGFKP